MTAFLILALIAICALPLGLALVERRARPRESDPDGLDDSLDLHTFPPSEIGYAVRGYLEAAAEQGLAEVRLIHGKGKGVQRRRVQQLLREHPLVLEFFDAPPGRGAWGATIARLRVERSDD